MKKYFFLILMVLGLYSCTNESSDGESNTQEVDVYVAGSDSASTDSYNSLSYGTSTYWINGEPVNITERTYDYGPDAAAATAIAVSGVDVYVVGYQQSCGFSCGDYGRFWNNGISVDLDLPTYPNSITISNNDIYIAGSNLYLTGNGGNAAYLKNEVKIELPSGTTGAISTAIAVSGNDVYVSGIGITGSINNGSQNYIAKYWKNSDIINLTDGTDDAQAWSIAVSGNDVYVAGMEWNGNSYQDYSGNTHKKSVAKYWKNGTAVNLTDGTEDAVANSIIVSGTDVYVAGTVYGYATYWKNGVAVQLTDGIEFSEAKAIAVSGTDVYVAGTVNAHAAYWKNGVVVRLSNVESYANSIFLVEK